MAEESALGLVAKINQELDKTLAKADALVKALAGSSGGTGTSGGSMMPGSLAAVNAAGQTMNRMEVAGKIVQGVTKVAGNVVSMLPDAAQVVARAGGYYGATVRAGGGMSRRVLENITFGGLQGGLSRAGIDADIAAYAGAVGLNPNSPLYRQLLAGAGNATKYLNMDTLSAFSAMEGLTSGVGSGNFMARYGIFTSDPQTGRVRSQNEIFGELANRMTAGQPRATEAQILEDLRRGPLGSNIRNSGMSAEQQYMFSQYMIERARGRTLDLSDPNAMKQMMAEAEAQGNANPFAAAYRISTAQTGAMGAAEQNYLKSIQDATPAIEKMNKAAGELAASFVGYAAVFAQTLLGDRATSGGLGALGSIATTIGSVAAGTALGKSMGNKVSGVVAKAGQTGLGKGARLGGPAALTGLAATGIGEGIKFFSGSQQGDLTNKFANALSSAGTAGGFAAASFLVPGLQAAAPFITGAAALAGGIYGFMTGGAADSFGQAGFGARSVSAPLSGGIITSHYGAERSDGSIHKGVDIAMPEGTPVYAVAAGKVIKSQTGSGPRSYGEYIEIQHSSEYTTLYAHLRANSRRVRVGDTVSSGQQIGEVGSTGLSSGPHLHLEVRRNGTKINPESVLPEDLMGSGKVSGDGKAKASNASSSSKPRLSLLDLATKPQAGPNSGFTNLSVSVSGVSGTLRSVAQVVASGTGTSIRGLSSPVTGMFGTDAVERGTTRGGTGGSENYLPLAGSTIQKMNLRNGQGGTSVLETTSSREKPNVNINVTIAQSSPAEAKRLAEMVRSYLEDDAIIANMGRR